jgi:tRNA threonylcarbamoyl adenosine modification protein YeaZ
MKVLAVDAALGRCSVTLVADGELVTGRTRDGARGHPALLPAMVLNVLSEAGLAATCVDLVAVTVGPGSFTGIRAGLALAHGLGLGLGLPVIGVTVGEALADSLASIGSRRVWSAIDSRRGRVFLERDGIVTAFVLDELPFPMRPIAVAGNAAVEVAARLAARGADVMLTDARLPVGRHIARAAAQRHAGALPPLAAEPLYVDPPEARLPAGGLRPAPCG